MKEGSALRFTLPASYEELIVIGAVMVGPLAVELFEIPANLIAELGNAIDTSIDLLVTHNRMYDLRKIDTFAERL